VQQLLHIDLDISTVSQTIQIAWVVAVTNWNCEWLLDLPGCINFKKWTTLTTLLRPFRLTSTTF